MRMSKLTIALALLVPAVTAAQGPDNENPDRFSFRIGAQAFTTVTTTLRLDSETLGRGTEITLEDDVNLEDSTQAVRLDGTYNFNRRHHAQFAYYDIDRKGGRATTRDIDFGDVFFPAGTEVKSVFQQEIIKLSYGYNFLIREKGKLGASIGLHTMKFTTGLVGPNNVEEASADAPLPVIGLRGHYQFAEKWRLVGGLEWFDVQVGDVQGTFTDFILSVEHDTFDRFGFGVGINKFGLNVEASDTNLRGIIDLDFDSFVLYFRGSLGQR